MTLKSVRLLVELTLPGLCFEIALRPFRWQLSGSTETDEYGTVRELWIGPLFLWMWAGHHALEAFGPDRGEH